MKEVMKALAELYEAYYRNTSNVSRQRRDVETALFRVMQAYDVYLN